MSNKLIRILIVDDDTETLKSLETLLALEPDFKVIGTASNGNHAVYLAKLLRPDITLMDINMPELDGLTATNRIVKNDPEARVITMSVQNDADYMQRAMLAGARFFLSKPMNMDDLYRTIRNVYESYRGIRQYIT